MLAYPGQRRLHVCRQVAQVRSYLDAGVEEVDVRRPGPDMAGFFDVYAREVLPQSR
ncbi:hypothetical protein [Mycolicibacterium sp. SCSIO 43805]|uniref:hypothetical protein n=1 Tax=Mycolicibacterium sp. SCSIO 43805 TaxID=3378074 RepID=UPI003AB16C49